LVEFRFGLGVE